MRSTEAPDRIFVNARIWTGDVRRPKAAALAVRGGRIVAVGEDAEVGVLAPGMLADLVVLPQDVPAGPPSSLLEARALLTVMGGRDTHRDPTLAPNPG